MTFQRTDGPIGADRFYLGVGIIASAIYNSKRTRKSDPVLSPYEFIPEFYKTKVEIEEDHANKITAFLAAIGAPPRPKKVQKAEIPPTQG